MTLAVGGAVTTLLGFVIVALAAYWVYRDAKTKGVSDPAGWGILTFLLFIIAFPLYLLWGRKRVTSKSQSVVTTTAKRFCVECGMELPADVRFCTGCGKEASQATERI
jgi:uncharacterized membrane protein